jgi:hypothetical protein
MARSAPDSSRFSRRSALSAVFRCCAPAISRRAACRDARQALRCLQPSQVRCPARSSAGTGVDRTGKCRWRSSGWGWTFSRRSYSRRSRGAAIFAPARPRDPHAGGALGKLGAPQRRGRPGAVLLRVLRARTASRKTKLNREYRRTRRAPSAAVPQGPPGEQSGRGRTTGTLCGPADPRRPPAARQPSHRVAGAAA